MKVRSSLIAALTLAALLVAVRLAFPPVSVPNRLGFPAPPRKAPTVAIRGATLPEEYLVPDVVVPRDSYFILASDTNRPESGKWTCDSRGFIKGVPGVCDLLDRRQPRELRMTLQDDETLNLKWETAPPK